MGGAISYDEVEGVMEVWMSAIGSLSSSVTAAFSRGFETLDRAAKKMASGADGISSEMTPEQIALESEKEDPLISGVMDLSTAKLQIGVAAALMRVHKQTTGSLLDALG
jgi:hypothetical protein